MTSATCRAVSRRACHLPVVGAADTVPVQADGDPALRLPVEMADASAPLRLVVP